MIWMQLAGGAITLFALAVLAGRGLRSVGDSYPPAGGES